MRTLRSLSISLLFAAVLLGAEIPASAAELEYSGLSLPKFSLSYSVSFPTAGTANFLDNSASFVGFGGDWNEEIKSTPLYWGFSLRWLYFRNVDDKGTFTTGTTTATGRLYRSVDSFPIALTLKYTVPSGEGRFLPYIGLGAGTIYGMRELAIGALSQNEYGWQFLLAPEAGAVYKVSSMNSALFSVRYDAGFGSDAIAAISNVSLSIGVGSNF